MSLLNRIDESKLSTPPLFGHVDILSKCRIIIDKVYGDDKDHVELFDELEIKSSFLLHGPTGTGKTTIALQLAQYALEKYGIDTFEILPQSIITTALGKTVENLAGAFEEIRSKSNSGAVLLLDEFDRFMVDRSSSIEVSELKRAVITTMDFLQSLRVDDKITVIATTNSIKSVDRAIQRRFSLCFDVQAEEEQVRHYAECLKKRIFSAYGVDLLGAFKVELKTISEIKLHARQELLKYMIEGNKK